MGTPSREPQEYSRNILEYKHSGGYVPIILLLHSLGSLFGVPSKVPVVHVATGIFIISQGDQRKDTQIPFSVYAAV